MPIGPCESLSTLTLDMQLPWEPFSRLKTRLIPEMHPYSTFPSAINLAHTARPLGKSVLSKLCLPCLSLEHSCVGSQVPQLLTWYSWISQDAGSCWSEVKRKRIITASFPFAFYHDQASAPSLDITSPLLLPSGHFSQSISSQHFLMA